MDIYKDIIKLNNSISIDATSFLVQKIDPENKISVAIFLYQAVVSGISGIVSLLQMSEKHNAYAIHCWMSEWLHCGGKVLHEVNNNFSFVLLNTVAHVFNGCSLAQYIKTCLKWLNYDEVDVPICRIRVDIAHIIKMISRWQCFHGKGPQIRDFYMNCVGFLTTIESKDRFESILLSILIVALSECADKDTEYANKHKFLLERICNFMIDIKENPDEKSDDNYHPLNEIDAVIEHNNSSHLDKLYANAKEFATKMRSGQKLNLYYFPDFVTPFMRFATYYVLWTNVMMQKTEIKYSVASSARLGTYFQ